jgi:ATP-dependent Clp protease ATP-binding subunit ClpA
MFERFTTGARDAVMTHAPAEARRRGDRRVGTEHLLLAVLHDPQAADLLGVSVAAAREALAALDELALAAVGISALGVQRSEIPAPAKRAPFTSGAKAALSRALAAARRSRAGEVTAAHLLLALLAGQRTDPATDVLAEQGVDRAAAHARIVAAG